jgi:hypothetical protein
LIFLIRNYILLVVIIFHFQRIDASNDGGVMVLQEAFASVGGRRARRLWLRALAVRWAALISANKCTTSCLLDI